MSTMRAFVITAPRAAEVREVERPVAGPGEAVVDVELAGLCGTDREFFTGEMSYLHTGEAAFPMRIGHEWCGRVASVGEGVDPAWLGRRVTGDTMLGCGACARCRDGRQHLCADRHEIGIRNGWPGALAEQLPVPATALLALPETMDPEVGAMVEPGGNALRAVWGAEAAAGRRVLVMGAGAIGLLAAMQARALGAEVHDLVHGERSRTLAAALGLGRVWTRETLPPARFDAVIDATNSPDMPALALDLVEPGRRVVFIGLAGEPSHVDSRRIALQDVTVVGVLSGSGGLAGAAEQYDTGAVDPRPLVAATVGLDEVGGVLAGRRDADWGARPKVLVDPRR